MTLPVILVCVSLVALALASYVNAQARKLLAEAETRQDEAARLLEAVEAKLLENLKAGTPRTR